MPKKIKNRAHGSAPIPPDYNKFRPSFFFGDIQKGFQIRDLDDERKLQLVERLEQQSGLTWGAMIQTSKHAFGLETIPRKNIVPDIPDRYTDEKKFVVIRYTGNNRSMVGVRVGSIFRILWVERDFGDVYDHG